MRDLDFLYYQFMPLHRLPIYSNLAEKRPVIVSASLSSACFPTSLVIHHRRCCSSVSDHPLSCSYLLLLHLLSFSVSFLFRGKGRTAFLCRWKMRPRRASGRRRVPRVDKRKREKERKAENERKRIEEERWNEGGVCYEVFEYAGRMRYIVGKGETKKTRSRRRT